MLAGAEFDQLPDPVCYLNCLEYYRALFIVSFLIVVIPLYGGVPAGRGGSATHCIPIITAFIVGAAICRPYLPEYSECAQCRLRNPENTIRQ